MRDKIKLIGAIVLLVIAAVLLIRQGKPRQAVYTETQVLVDVKANKVFAKPIKIGAEGVIGESEFPTDSPYSEGKNAYPAYQCPKCNTVFAMYTKPLVEGETPDMSGGFSLMPACPSCGNTEFDLAKLPAGQQSMDIPGPVQIVETR